MGIASLRDVLGQGRAGKRGAVLPVWKAAPKVETAARHDPRPDAKRLQPARRLAPGPREAPAQLFHVLAVAAAREDACDQLDDAVEAVERGHARPKLRIEGSRPPVPKARPPTLARMAAITAPVRVASVLR